METQYPYERRPKLLDRFINWRNTGNRHITRAPLIIITGAGASVPLGVPSLKLPPRITLASGLEIETQLLAPPASQFTEELDLESLMIIASAMKVLPRDVVQKGLGTTQADKERSLAVLVATIQFVMPRAGGRAILPQPFVMEVVKRIIDLDIAMTGALLDQLYDAIKTLIVEGCLRLNKGKIAPTYAPLFKRLIALLSAESRGRRGLTIPTFTTNYDETFEFMFNELAAEMSREISAGFSVFNSTIANAGHPHWRTFSASGYAGYKPPRDARDRLTIVIYYLHGSVCWATSEEAKPDFKIYVADAIATRQVQYYRALLAPDGQKVLYGKSHEELSNLLAPTRKDPFRPGSIFYSMRLGYLFLEKCLSRAKVVLAIGYSFRDSDCLELLLKIWDKQEYPKVILLDPNPEPILARLGHSKNVIPIKGKFGDEDTLNVAADEISRHLKGS